MVACILIQQAVDIYVSTIDIYDQTVDIFVCTVDICVCTVDFCECTKDIYVLTVYLSSINDKSTMQNNLGF